MTVTSTNSIATNCANTPTNPSPTQHSLACKWTRRNVERPCLLQRRTLIRISLRHPVRSRAGKPTSMSFHINGGNVCSTDYKTRSRFAHDARRNKKFVKVSHLGQQATRAPHCTRTLCRLSSSLSQHAINKKGLSGPACTTLRSTSTARRVQTLW